MQHNSNVHILFTDIQMPGLMDGMELARIIHIHWPKVLLLITSGNVRPPKYAIPDRGHFLSKPYQPDAVIREIQMLELEAATK